MIITVSKNYHTNVYGTTFLIHTIQSIHSSGNSGGNISSQSEAGLCHIYSHASAGNVTLNVTVPTPFDLTHKAYLRGHIKKSHQKTEMLYFHIFILLL